jgi:hypothetical protein
VLVKPNHAGILFGRDTDTFCEHTSQGVWDSLEYSKDAVLLMIRGRLECIKQDIDDLVRCKVSVVSEQLVSQYFM